MGATDLARQVKHEAAQGWGRVEQATGAVRDRWYTLTTPSRPFDADRYRRADGQFALEDFLARGPEAGPASVPTQRVPRRIFVMWTGENPMTQNRRRHLAAIRDADPDLEVVLITPETLEEWVVTGHPLHPSYAHLSAVHRSDYLRSYLLHHHGGGYSDVKQAQHAWGPCFDTINADPAIWIVGYPEYSRAHIAALETRVGADLRHRFAHVAGNGAFIARAGTPFTTLWLDEVDARLRYFDAALRRRPATDPFGRNDGYPVPWSCLQGQVFQPLQLKFGDHVTLDPRLRPVIGGHR